MSKGLFWGVFAAALVLALVFRLKDPGVRPMHHDEANQAVRFGMLLETGDYRYDPHEHHGPTLYFLSLPFAWMRGQRTLAALDERTLRLVPAMFGAGLVLLFGLLVRNVGRTAVATAAALAAISPLLTYFSRFYIQESLFVFFAVAFLIALGRYATAPRMSTVLWAGALAGLTYATKETWLIVLPAAAAACAIAVFATTKSADRSRIGAQMRASHAFAAAGAAFVPALLFYTGFFRNSAGVIDSFRAFPSYLERGVGPGPHVHPWFYYLRTLSWSSSGGLVWTDALVLTLAVAAIVHTLASGKRSFWPVYLCAYALVTTAVFSAIPYKTPWNMLPFYAAIVLIAGIGASALLDVAGYSVLRVLIVLAMVGAGVQFAAQSRRANFIYPADERNPYAYAQTSTDFVRLAARVHDLAAQHPDGHGMLIKVVAGPYEQWPFPWYARDLTRVGYWSRAAEAGALDVAPVIVASQENAPAVEAAIGNRYISEFYGLRPGVLLTLYVEQGLWERYLKSRR